MKSIHQYHFSNEKYGKTLLVDIVPISEINKYIDVQPIHRLTFYDMTFITKGNENLSINQRELQVGSGDIICSIPGEIWSWPKKTSLEGYVLLFEAEFLLSFFNDKQFLNKFKHLQRDRLSPLLRIDEKLFNKNLVYLEDIQNEIQLGIASNEHILRALVYLILSVIDQGTTVNRDINEVNQQIVNRHIQTFVKLVDEHYLNSHDVQFYAGKLFITTKHLNRVTKESLGSTAKVYILSKVIQEAKSLLKYSNLSVAQISIELKFEVPSYFVRLFRKYVGMTPKQFRDQ
jgi:AraC-like DNA-binding protein